MSLHDRPVRRLVILGKGRIHITNARSHVNCPTVTVAEEHKRTPAACVKDLSIHVAVLLARFESPFTVPRFVIPDK